MPTDNCNFDLLQKFEGYTGDESDEEDNILTSTLTRENTYVPDSDSEHEDTQNMAKPEFEGTVIHCICYRIFNV